MIFICGTGCAVEQLPLHDTLQYSIVNDKNKIASTLMLGLRKGDVVSCYIHKQYEGMKRPAEYESKVVIFEDDDDLIKKLSGSADIAEPKEPEPEPVVEEVPVMPQATAEELDEMQARMAEADTRAKEEAAAAHTESKPIDSVEDVSDIDEVDEVADDEPAIVDAGDLFEADILRTQLASSKAIIEQNKNRLEAIINERESLEHERDDVYNIALEQMDEMRAEYDKKLDEAQQVVEQLKKQLEEASELKGNILSPFIGYAEKPRAMIKAGIKLEKKYPNIVAVAASSTDTVATLNRSLALLASSGYNGYILDFTGDPIFSAALGNIACNVKLAYMLAQNPNAQLTQQDREAYAFNCAQYTPIEFLKNHDLNAVCSPQFGNCRVSSAGYYSDLILLVQPWEKIFEEISNQVNGAQVILLLPPVTSFVGRYVSSYLATGITVNIATVCVPSALYSAESHLKAFPDRRVRVFALDYAKLPQVDAVLSRISTRFTTRAFGVNMFLRDPATGIQTLQSDLANNNSMWLEAFNPIN